MKVALLSVPRLLAFSFLGSLWIVPCFIIVFTFYPSGVPPGPLLSLFVALTMLVAVGLPVALIFWSVRSRARAPDDKLPRSAVKLIPYPQVTQLRVLGRQATIVTASKKYVCNLPPDYQRAMPILEGAMAGRLTSQAQNPSLLLRARRIGSLGGLLIVAATAWTYASLLYPSVPYNQDASELVFFLSFLAVLQSVSDVSNSTSGNWMTAHDWSVAGYYCAWFALTLVAVELSRARPHSGQLTVFGALTPLYASPAFPTDPQGWAAFAGEVGFALLGGLFLTLCFRNTAQMVGAGLFRAVGPAYIVCTLLFTLGGVALYPVFYVLQAAAFLSMKVSRGNPASAAATASPKEASGLAMRVPDHADGV
ncbi:MAG: hypothetical protein ABSF83_03280 [Nitrososphaerales archaeon]